MGYLDAKYPAPPRDDVDWGNILAKIGIAIAEGVGQSACAPADAATLGATAIACHGAVGAGGAYLWGVAEGDYHVGKEEAAGGALGIFGATTTRWLGRAGSAAEGGSSAIVESGKWDYLFGRVESGAHNAARSAENASQLARIGVYDTAEGRALLQATFDATLSSDANIVRTFSNKYGTFQVRDSLFAGPGGFLKFETTWQLTDEGYRLTTLIPYGGP